MANKFVVFTPTTGRRLNDMAGAWPMGAARGIGQYQPTGVSKVLVKLTTELAPFNRRVWGATEVFLDANGLATTVPLSIPHSL